MKELSQLLLQCPPKLDESLPKAELFNQIFSQLQERNSSNNVFIRRYMAKINKKYHLREELTSTAASTDMSPDNVSEQIRSQQEQITFLPSSQRFYTQSDDHNTPQIFSIRPSQFSSTILRASKNTDRVKEQGEVFKTRNTEGKGDQTIRQLNKRSQGFKKYLKNVFIKEVVKQEVKAQKIKEPIKDSFLVRKSNQSQRGSLPSNKQKQCLTIKSMLFGIQDLNASAFPSGSLSTISSEINVAQPQTANASEPCQNQKACNIFLPIISRQNFKKDKPKQKMVRVETQDNQRPDSKCRALWVSQSLHRIGYSFRINALAAKKQR